MSAAHEEAIRLLRLAHRDRRAFERLRDGMTPGDFPAASFHAQQAVEKAMKAILCLSGIEFRRTHDLLELADTLASSGKELPVADDQLLRLTPYAVEFRYDDQALPLLTPEQATAAVDSALRWASALIEDPP